MSGVTRRDVLGVAAVGALGMALPGCGREPEQAQPQGVTAGTAAPAPYGNKVNIKITVEGLTVIHREMDATSQPPRIKFVRLAPINPLANPLLKLMPHATILRIPRGLLKSWTPAPLLTTMDYVYWSMAGWRSALEVTAGGKVYSTSGETRLRDHRRPINMNDCAAVKANWANADLLANFASVGVTSALKPDWHLSQAVAGYLDLPFGSLEDPSLIPETRHEEFDLKRWYLGTAAQPQAGQSRALKNVARFLLSDVEKARITTPGGDIEFIDFTAQEPDNYEWKKMPIVVSNLAISSHEMLGEDFQAYYEILAAPPEIAARRYPSTEDTNACGTTVKCGCCPPLET